jgi:hypothetical protein
MDKNSTIKSRAYQVQNADYILPEVFPLTIGEAEIIYPTAEDAPSASDLYLVMKAQVEMLERAFDSLEEMDDNCECMEDCWYFTTDDVDVLHEFAEVYEGELVSDNKYLYTFFVYSVEAEFERAPKLYEKYSLNEVCQALQGQYSLIPDEKAGGYWKRTPGGTAAPVRVATTVEEEVDGSEY